MTSESDDREGGVKIVFDVPDRLVDKTSADTAGEFDVRGYYAHPELIR